MSPKLPEDTSVELTCTYVLLVLSVQMPAVEPTVVGRMERLRATDGTAPRRLAARSAASLRLAIMRGCMKRRPATRCRVRNERRSTFRDDTPALCRNALTVSPALIATSRVSVPGAACCAGGVAVVNGTLSSTVEAATSRPFLSPEIVKPATEFAVVQLGER